jgi:hypothetical protein
VATQPTATARMHRTALKGCLTPRLAANVFLAGKPRLVSKLHRPSARTAADRGGPSYL